jgi:hypothetical protein
MFNIYDHAESIIRRCNQPKSDLLGHGKKKEDYLFIPSKSHKPRALAVAHCDTVFGDIPSSQEMARREASAQASYQDKLTKFENGEQKVKPVYYAPSFLSPARREGSNRIVSGALDDRLGVAIILDILPHFMPEFAFDILLTDDEETGNSTARDFSQDYLAGGEWGEYIDSRLLNYQFIFEFDRMGVDAATYDFGNSKASNLLSDTGWEESQGSFTDICDLDSFDLWACNFGCGYHNQHTRSCSVDLRELYINLLKFSYFVEELGDTVLYNEPKPRYRGWSNAYNYSKSSKVDSYAPYETYVDDDDYYKDEKYDSYVIGRPKPATQPSTNNTFIRTTNTVVQSGISFFQAAIKIANQLKVAYRLSLLHSDPATKKLYEDNFTKGPCGEIFVKNDQYDEYDAEWQEYINALAEAHPSISELIDEVGLDEPDTEVVDDSVFYVQDDTSRAWDETWDHYRDQYGEESDPYDDDDDQAVIFIADPKQIEGDDDDEIITAK